MGNDPAAVIFAVLFPVLLVGELVLLAVVWRAGGGRLPRIAPSHDARVQQDPVANDVWLVSVWLVATGLAMGFAFVAAFVAVHVLLFALGSEVATLGMLASGAFLAAIPIGVAVIMRRRARRP